MSDDLTEGLREAGHDDLAEALERKQLAGRLRESGRDDLADQLDRPAEAVQPSADETFLRELKEKSAAGWTSTSGLTELSLIHI